MEMNNFSGVFHDGLLMQVNVSFWSGAKILRPEDLGLKDKDVADAYKLGRKMLIPDDVIHNFRHIEGQARNLVAKNSFPFPMGNARFVPRKCFKDVNSELATLKASYMALAEDLISKYEEYRQQMRPVYEQAANTAFEQSHPGVVEFGVENLGAIMAKREEDRKAFMDAFLARIDSYYPAASTLRERFSLDWSIYEIAVPNMDMTNGNDVIQREEATQEIRKQMNEKIGGFVTDVVKVLRQETVEVCGRIAKSIQEGKVIRSTTIDSLKTFIDRFKNMNFVGDQTIADQLDAVQKEFLTVHPSTYAEDVDLRAELGKRLEAVVKVADQITEQDIGSVTGQYTRAINWM